MDKLVAYLQRQNEPRADNGRLRREIAYERLKDALRHAALEPGEPLSETRLSEALGISRTPVREALQMLAQEGLLHVIPGRAVTVAAHSVQQVLDIVHMRLLLEPELVRLVAETGAAVLGPLQQALADMETAVTEGDQIAWSRADTRYHEALSNACPNALLGETVMQLRNRVHHLANVDSRMRPERLVACTAEHRLIVEAIAGGDANAAEGATRQHIDALRDSLFNRLNYGP